MRNTASLGSTIVTPLLAAVLVAACASPAPPPSPHHLVAPASIAGKAPEFVSAPVVPRPPKPAAERQELYSVIVQEMNVQELLFALARDAKVNISVHPDIKGKVTMSVLDQTLGEILDVMRQQVDMRYELNGKNLSIRPDLPYLKMYRIDYPNIARNVQSQVSISTTVASTGSGTGGSGSNASDTMLKNTSNNQFWETLINNIRDLLRETDMVKPENAAAAPPPQAPQASQAPQTPARAGGATPASVSTGAPATVAGAMTGSTSGATLVSPTKEVVAAPREAASVIANPENGVINVRATQRQHEKIREFIDGILENAHRQVLIEATIVEVDLSDRYQQGIDWSLVRSIGRMAGTGFTFLPAGPAAGLVTGGILSSIASSTINHPGNNSLTGAVRLLESFGNLRVLSSPKLSVMNSQTSILKVVDNEVYFNVSVTPGTAATATSPATQATYSTTINTVPIGFLMSVSPQIGRHGEVILNLRPTITRISGYAKDPNPDLARVNVTNQIPIVQSREMESILRIQSGNVAVLGGLIQDSRNRNTDGLPGLNGMPKLEDMFSYRDSRNRKTELVIFLRPTLLTDASLNGDYQDLQPYLSETQKAFGLPGKTTTP